MKKFIKCVLLIFVLAGTFYIGYSAGHNIDHDIRYFVEELEIGADDKLWARVEVWNRSTDDIEYIDMKFEEGFIIEQ